MSRIAEELTVSFTGQRKINQFKPLEHIKAETTCHNFRSVNQDLLEKIRVSLIIEASGFVENSRVNKDIVIYNLKRKILEEVFGEFREDLYNIIGAIHEHDLEKVLNSVHKLEKKMFKEGL